VTRKTAALAHVSLRAKHKAKEKCTSLLAANLRTVYGNTSE